MLIVPAMAQAPKAAPEGQPDPGLERLAEPQRAEPHRAESIPGLRVPFGSDEATIREAYKITAPMQLTGGNRRPTLKSPDLGLWFFFDAKGLNDNIRIEAPFKGQIAGVGVGETLAQLTQKRGKPVREPWKFGQDNAYLYDLNPIARVRYDVAPDGRIFRIFILLRQLTSEVGRWVFGPAAAQSAPGGHT